MKYIDAEKLIAEIEALKYRKGFLSFENTEITEAYMARGVQFTCDDIVNLIQSLQREQPEVDLEKKLCEYFEGWRTNYYSETEELLKNNGCTVDVDDVKEIARHFYELGKNSK